MRVLVGPRTDPERDLSAAAAAIALAGLDGEVVSLRERGVRTLSRSLSQAEVALLREALRGGAGQVAAARADGWTGGAQTGGERPACAQRALVGYLCRGGLLPPGAAPRAAGVAADRGLRLVAVTDHADLTWRSPLAGPNDASAGPRFPSMTGIYCPQTVWDRVAAVEGMIVVCGVVAGVRDDARPTAYEVETAVAQGHAAVSSELVPVAIVAAHLGLRIAAVLVAGT